MRPKGFASIALDPRGPWHPTIFGSGQPEYQDLPALRHEGPERNVMTRWTFTDDERKLIAAGEDLWLEQLTFGQTFQPQRPSVGVPEWTGLEDGMST